MTDLRSPEEVFDEAYVAWFHHDTKDAAAIIEADRAATRADERAKVVALLRTLDEASWSIDEIADFIEQEFSHE